MAILFLRISFFMCHLYILDSYDNADFNKYEIDFLELSFTLLSVNVM